MDLSDNVLEIGAGAGAATTELRRRAGCVTSLEYSDKLAARAARQNGGGRTVRGDAACLPFAAKCFSSVLAVLMLHHLPSREAQDLALREAARVLRPGGLFVVFEIEDRWLQRLTHFRSTYTPLRCDTVAARLAAAGFASSHIDRTDRQPQGFRVLAKRT